MAKSSGKVITDKKQIKAIFNRGFVAEIFPTRQALFEKLLSGEQLKMYIGFDPTASALHLGHARNLMFLEELRQFGHEVVVLFGDFTARIGDPTNKSAIRKALSEKEIKANMKDWFSQIKPLLNFDDQKNPARVEYNSKWLAKLSLADILSLAANFTVQQMLERDMFQKRLKENAPIHLHEFLYPLMQGYDSVALDVDVELCGTDQTFNALAGRTLVKRLKNKEKFVIALNLLENPKTGELMSKSRGTGVFLGTSPSEMFGAIMAQPDEMIEPLFVNLTRIPLSEKSKIMGMGPRKAKALVAKEIVKKFYGEKKAEQAEEEFEKTFSEGGIPKDIPVISFVPSNAPSHGISPTLIANGFVSSKTEWHRLIKEGAVKIHGGEKITDPNFMPKKDLVLKIGKRRFVKIII